MLPPVLMAAMACLGEDKVDALATYINFQRRVLFEDLEILLLQNKEILVSKNDKSLTVQTQANLSFPLNTQKCDLT